MGDLPGRAHVRTVWLDCDPGTDPWPTPEFAHQIFLVSQGHHKQLRATTLCAEGPCSMQAMMMLLPSSLQASLPETTTPDRRPCHCDEKALYDEEIIVPCPSPDKSCNMPVQALHTRERDSHLSAGYDSRLRLLGVSTVAGNQTVEKVTLNALGLLTAAGLHDIRESLPAIFAFCASRTV